MASVPQERKLPVYAPPAAAGPSYRVDIEGKYNNNLGFDNGFDDVGKLMVYPIPPEDIYAGWAENIDVLRALPILKNCSTSVLEAIMGEEVDWVSGSCPDRYDLYDSLCVR